jgi:hypothetical protein
VTPLHETGAAATLRVSRVRRATLATIVLLLVQFGLGMAVNLYVSIPVHHAGAHGREYLSASAESVGWALAHGTATLAAHVIVGFLLTLSALGLVAQAVRLRRLGVLLAAMLGALCVIGAGFNGASFLDYAHNISSLIMALLFAGAVLCYLAIVYVTPAPPARLGTARAR